MKIKQRNLPNKKQSGAVLVLGLTMIMVLSVLVISSAKTTVLQQKMTSNLRDKELSFQAAESAIKAGESYLKDTAQEDLAGNFSGSGGLLLYDNDRSLAAEADWANLGSLEGQSLHQVNGKPVYIIEELPGIEVEGDSLSIPRAVTSAHFRITSKSSGGTTTSSTVLQTMYKK